MAKCTLISLTNPASLIWQKWGFIVDILAVDRDVRFASGKEESGHSQFAPLKLRSLAVVTSSGAQCAPANSTYGSSTARLFVSAPEVFTLALHHFLSLPLHRLAAVPRPGARVDTNGKRPTGAKVD